MIKSIVFSSCDGLNCTYDVGDSYITNPNEEEEEKSWISLMRCNEKTK